LMEEWGYGEGYEYAHDHEEGFTPMRCLPEGLSTSRFYEPTTHGYESRIAERMRKRGQID